MKNLVTIIVLALLVLISPWKSMAQDIPLIITQKKIDSVEQLLKNHPEKDQQKVLLLNKYAEYCIYNIKYLEGFNAALDARNISRDINFKGGEILYHLNLVRFLRNSPRGDYHRDEAKRLSKNKSLSKYFHEITFPEAFSGEYYSAHNSKTAVDETLQYYTKKGNKEIQVELMHRLAVYYFFVEKDYAKNIFYNKKAADIFESLGEDYWAILCRSYALFSQIQLENNNENIESTINEIIKGITNITDLKQRAAIYTRLANYYHYQGNQPALAVDYYLQSASLRENLNDTKRLADNYESLTLIYSKIQMPNKAYEAGLKNIELRKVLKDSTKLVMAYRRAYTASMLLKNYEKAEAYLTILKKDTTLMSPPLWLSYKYNLDAVKLVNVKKYKEALPFMELRHKYSKKANNSWMIPQASLQIANTYINLGDYPKAIKYALRANAENKVFTERTSFVINLHKQLSKIYEALGKKNKAYEHLKAYHKALDDVKITDETASIVRNEMQAALQKSSEKINQLDLEREKQAQANKMQRLWILSIGGALLFMLLILLILYRNNRQKQKANALLNQQKNEIQETLEKLKETQDQLIQSEKMASLGELTAGIAHEIQNPLNFVNNFSEVSNELIDEMVEEIKNKDYEEVEAIASDVKLNLEKINHHGKRADAIVKGMLQHSRSGSPTKELTDINKLTDEYFRLAYHGLRAKDKTFNANLVTDFDESIGYINIFPQDIGRVVLNLITNAFYVVHKKKLKNPENYAPTVSVKTLKTKKDIEIHVVDNGNGIPKEVLNKIFQPFFTTKPTGEGTGLGLSLSFDIVKAHGGELTVETKEGEGTTFKIIIPNDQ